jgi:hypothetical protein
MEGCEEERSRTEELTNDSVVGPVINAPDLGPRSSFLARIGAK